MLSLEREREREEAWIDPTWRSLNSLSRSHREINSTSRKEGRKEGKSYGSTCGNLDGSGFNSTFFARGSKQRVNNWRVWRDGLVRFFARTGDGGSVTTRDTTRRDVTCAMINANGPRSTRCRRPPRTTRSLGIDSRARQVLDAYPLKLFG